MALSNYSFCAFDNDGKPTFEPAAMGRLKLEPYKCWLYVHCEELWDDKEQFCKPVIAQVNTGRIDLLGVGIVVEDQKLEHPDGTPYGAVRFFSCQRWDSEANEYINYAGILCSAYLDPIAKWVKELKLPAGVETWATCSMHDEEGNKTRSVEFVNLNLPEDDKGRYYEEPVPAGVGESYYVGVTPAMRDAFLAWPELDKKYREKLIASGDFKSVNQGNLFFAAAGLGNNPVEIVGDLPASVLAMQLIGVKEPTAVRIEGQPDQMAKKEKGAPDVIDVEPEPPIPKPAMGDEFPLLVYAYPEKAVKAVTTCASRKEPAPWKDFWSGVKKFLLPGRSDD